MKFNPKFNLAVEQMQMNMNECNEYFEAAAFDFPPVCTVLVNKWILITTLQEQLQNTWPLLTTIVFLYWHHLKNETDNNTHYSHANKWPGILKFSSTGSSCLSNKFESKVKDV